MLGLFQVVSCWWDLFLHMAYGDVIYGVDYESTGNGNGGGDSVDMHQNLVYQT